MACRVSASHGQPLGFQFVAKLLALFRILILDAVSDGLPFCLSSSLESSLSSSSQPSPKHILARAQFARLEC